MLPSNTQHTLPPLAAFAVCQVPIKFRADTKLAEAGLHAYNAATYNFNVQACILHSTQSQNCVTIFNISS